MRRIWPDGATYVFQGTVVNNGAISDVSAIFTPGEGNEMELHWASISHNDATASTILALIRDDGARTLIEMANIAAVTTNSVIQVPPVGSAPATGGNFPQFTRPIMISGTMDLILTAEDIDDTEGITVALVARIIGDIPTLTTVGGGAETVTTNTSRVF